MQFESDFFVQNRQKLIKKMKDSSVLVLFSNDQFPSNGDQFFRLRQQSDLYYFTGIVQEKTALIIVKNQDSSAEEILFIIKPNKKMEIWEGKKLRKEEAQSISGIQNVEWNSNLQDISYAYIRLHSSLYALGTDAYANLYEYNIHVRQRKSIINAFPTKDIISPRSIIDSLRLIKSDSEIKAMQKAIDITNEAFMRILAITKPNMHEYEIEAEMDYIFKKNGSKGHAYHPIVGSGINACSLHYEKNSDWLRDGDMLLMDFGADWNYYAADLSRTIPVNGKFTTRQKQLYNIVLEVQKKSIELYIPGNTINIVNEKTNQWMKELLIQEGIKESVNDLFPHGTSHSLGIDVHDVGGTKDVTFEEGMVLTCEPGLYLENEAIGIRIENDIVVSERPIDLMINVIREVDEIEKAMSR